MDPMLTTAPVRKQGAAWAPLYRLPLQEEACSNVDAPWIAASFRACPPAPVWGLPRMESPQSLSASCASV